MKKLDKYVNKWLDFQVMNLKEVNRKSIRELTGIPDMILRELESYGVLNYSKLINNGVINEPMISLLKGIMFSCHNKRLLTSLFKKMSTSDRAVFLKNIDKKRYEVWIDTRVKNLKDNNDKVISGRIIGEAFSVFPKLKAREKYFKDEFKRLIKRAKWRYYKKKSGEKE